MKIVASPHAPKAIGPYSQAIIANNCVYTSGQIALDAETGEVIGSDASQQAEQVMKNLSEVLTEANSGLHNIFKTTCFLANMDDFAEFNKVYEKWIHHKPARSCVAVKALPRNVLVACDGVAFDFVSVFTGQAAVYRRSVNLLWHKNNLRISVWCDTSNQKDEGFCFIYAENTIKPHDHQGKRRSPYFLFLT